MMNNLARSLPDQMTHDCSAKHRHTMQSATVFRSRHCPMQASWPLNYAIPPAQGTYHSPNLQGTTIVQSAILPRLQACPTS